jgi:hypothetical protein
VLPSARGGNSEMSPQNMSLKARADCRSGNSFLIKSLHLAVAFGSYCSIEGSPYGS